MLRASVAMLVLTTPASLPVGDTLRSEAGTPSKPPPHCAPRVRDGYASIQVNVDPHGCNIFGDAANEPSIAVDPTDPRKIVIGWRQFDTVESDFRQAGYAYSHDGGHTWVFPGVLDPGVFHSDPVLDAGPDGTIYYYGLQFEGQFPLFRSSDGGVNWTAIEIRTGDKPWMVVDRTTAPTRGHIYFARHMEFMRSVDAGNTFQWWRERDLPIHPIVNVAPDGTLFIAGGDFFLPPSTTTPRRLKNF